MDSNLGELLEVTVQENKLKTLQKWGLTKNSR